MLGCGPLKQSAEHGSEADWISVGNRVKQWVGLRKQWQSGAWSRTLWSRNRAGSGLNLPLQRPIRWIFCCHITGI